MTRDSELQAMVTKHFSEVEQKVIEQVTEDFQQSYGVESNFYKMRLSKNPLMKEEYASAFDAALAIRLAQNDTNVPGWNKWVNNIKSCASFFTTLLILDDANLKNIDGNIENAADIIIAKIKGESNLDLVKTLLSYIKKEHHNTKVETILEKSLENRIQILEKIEQDRAEQSKTLEAEAAAASTIKNEKAADVIPSTSEEVSDLNNVVEKAMIGLLNNKQDPMHLLSFLSPDYTRLVRENVLNAFPEAKDFVKEGIKLKNDGLDISCMNIPTEFNELVKQSIENTSSQTPQNDDSYTVVHDNTLEVDAGGNDAQHASWFEV